MGVIHSAMGNGAMACGQFSHTDNDRSSYELSEVTCKPCLEVVRCSNEEHKIRKAAADMVITNEVMRPHPIHFALSEQQGAEPPKLACKRIYIRGGDQSTFEAAKVTCEDCLRAMSPGGSSFWRAQSIHYRTIEGEGPGACGRSCAIPELECDLPYCTSILDRVTCEACKKAAPGMKYDGEKARMSLLPFGALELVARVMTYGAKKYAPNNWKTLENAEERYANAMLRHFKAWQSGERLDDGPGGSGLPHLAQVACNALFLCAFGEGTDGTRRESGEK